MKKEFIKIDTTNIHLIKDLYTQFIKEIHASNLEDFDTATLNFINGYQNYIITLLIDSIPRGVIEYRILPKKLRDTKNIMEITSLFVKSQDRKKGLGKDLVEYVKRHATQLKCDSIVLYSGLELENAHKFYEKIGFSKSCYFFEIPLS